ncbi:Nitrilase [Rubrobacter xylanophilus DSM 9941]|uniref:Nitrilase n=1 Tax=Rubrobacter xylanophilus (strain DSM 9941 / JCM 11954 / NBRC 16129 / PRD-1) TaxID=266117 RepID=Q1AZG5_RUBXD|nr:carbon-nitrogen hydrolase family protein [Rubrobacter xylanophilus]ABG03213.1 Nitrilase [Rubrobacter xylanophilus DSM 9941]
MDSQFPKSFRAAAVQASPVHLKPDATVDKLESLVAEAARGGAQLVVFSESFIPAFPVWNLVLPPVDQHDLFRRLFLNSVLVPGPITRRLAEIAKRHDVYLSVGVTERTNISMGCLYNTNLLFAPTGELLNHRRKLVPTWAEKLTHAWGDASDLRPVQTELGNIGVLICGENTNPLARYTLLAQGEQIHIATYPPAWPFRRTGGRQTYNLRKAIEIRSAAHAFEGKVFNIVSSGLLDEGIIKDIIAIAPDLEPTLREAPAPASMILGPTGEPLVEPLVGDEGIIYADIDVTESIEVKQAHDIVGYYQRFDVFQLTVDQRPQLPINLIRGPETSYDSRMGAETVETAVEEDRASSESTTIR